MNNDKKIYQWMSKLILLNTVMFSSIANANEPSAIEATWLKVKPRKCVALHQGQMCYQKLVFRWQLRGTGEYCLYAASKSMPITCWTDDERTRYEYQLKSTNGEQFEIREKNDPSSLAAVEVVAAWVYKSKKKKTGSWRLF